MGLRLWKKKVQIVSGIRVWGYNVIMGQGELRETKTKDEISWF